MSFKIKGLTEKPEKREVERQQYNKSSFAPANIENINESSEISETIKEMNDDELNPDGFSSIDMKTRLNNIEISSMIALDSLVALGFLPTETGFITRSKKRLAISLNGKGREEIVDITGRMREQQTGQTAFSKIKSFFGSGGE